MVKTITITDGAYKKLKRMKIGEESFSDLINRLDSNKGDIKSIVGIMKNMDIKEEKKRIKEFREEFTRDMEKRENALVR